MSDLEEHTLESAGDRCEECGAKLTPAEIQAAMETGVPVIFGVLTTETFEQAMDRAGGKHGNKGWDAAMAAMETADVLDRLPKREAGPE